MANILTRTEEFSHADWVVDDAPLTITTDQHAAPAFAGGSAGLGDKLDDANASLTPSVRQAKTITSDSSSWTMSLYVRKDAVTTRFPMMHLRFQDGTATEALISINTSAGTVADYPGFAPNNKGVVDVDANWWRVWLVKANNGTGNTSALVRIYPAGTGTLGNGFESPTTGFIGAWGANLTNTSTLQTYEPDPTYSFAGSAALTGTMVGDITEGDIVSGGRTLVVTLTGDTWIAI